MRRTFDAPSGEDRESLEDQIKRKFPLAVIAAFCAVLAPDLAGEASAGGQMQIASVQIAMPLESHFHTRGVIDRGELVRPVRDCKRRRFYNPGVFVDGSLEYLDPYYGHMNPGVCVDPPSHEPAPRKSHRLSCQDVQRLLHQHGYRRIRAHDCKGKIYNFDAYYGSKRYKLKVRSRNGSIKSRARI